MTEETMNTPLILRCIRVAELIIDRAFTEVVAGNEHDIRRVGYVRDLALLVYKEFEPQDSANARETAIHECMSIAASVGPKQLWDPGYASGYEAGARTVALKLRELLKQPMIQMPQLLGQSQGLCATTQTERFMLPCAPGCQTYSENLGPCAKYEEGSRAGYCVYCDHTEACHPKRLQPSPSQYSSVQDYLKAGPSVEERLRQAAQPPTSPASPTSRPKEHCCAQPENPFVCHRCHCCSIMSARCIGGCTETYTHVNLDYLEGRN